MLNGFLIRLAVLVGAALAMAAPSGAARADTILQDVYGCRTPRTLALLENLIAQGEKEQFEKLVGQSCIPLSKGESVTAGKTSGTAVCVKRSGQSRCYWISRTAVGR